jgi:hypothetical protein
MQQSVGWAKPCTGVIADRWWAGRERLCPLHRSLTVALAHRIRGEIAQRSRGSAVNGSRQVTSIDGPLEEKGEEAEPALIHESASRRHVSARKTAVFFFVRERS